MSDRDRILAGFSYYGGKQRLAPRIAELLPMRGAYIEPFAGAASVLLARPKAKTELLNDTNRFLVDWWYSVRDRAAEFIELLQYTPNARVEREAAFDVVSGVTNCDDQLYRALAFHVLVECSMSSNITSKNGWRRGFSAATPHKIHNKIPRIRKIARRVQHVQLDNVDACSLLGHTRTKEDLVMYVDPPYPGRAMSGYYGRINFGHLIALLLKQRGAVAVSGYEDSWPELTESGWRLESFQHNMSASPQTRGPVTEYLWMNYDKEGDNL